MTDPSDAIDDTILIADDDPANLSKPDKAKGKLKQRVKGHMSALANAKLKEEIVKHKQAEEELRRSNRELYAISHCNQILLRAVDEQALLDDICRIVCVGAGYEMAWVGYAENDDAKTVRPVSWAGNEAGYLASANITWADTEHGNGPTGTAIRQGETACIQDFIADPLAAPWREYARQCGYRSNIALPLKDENGKTFGALTIYSKEPETFTASEIRLLDELASDLGFGISVLRARARRKRVESIMQARLRLLEFSNSHALDELLTATLDEIEHLTGSAIGFYHFLEADQKTLSLQEWSTNTLKTMCTADGKGSHYDVADAGVWVDCVHERRAIIHNDYASLPHRKGMPDGHAVVVREVVVPIFRGDLIKAIIGVGNKTVDYDESDIEIVSQLGDLSWDIAERKQTENALRISDSRYRMAQAIGHVGNWEYDLQTTQFWGSDEAKRIYGFDPAQPNFSTDEVENCIPERERVHQALTDLLETGKPYNLEFEIHPRNGSEPKIIASIAKLQQDESRTPVKVVGVIQDITERKRIEEEIRKLNQDLERRVADRTAALVNANKELEAFAYSVSHDLRAPLRHINGFMALLQAEASGTPDEKSQHYLAVIADATRRMGMLIDDLLSFSRMNRNEMTESQVNLNRLVQDVIQEFNPEAEGRAIQWEISALPRVTGDRAMLRMVLVNLISNALKFTRSRIPAKIEIGWMPGSEAETVVFVRDNGVGFDMNYADKLFGVFQRLHNANEFEGTGIGLANVRRIIERHGGKTWAEGEPGKGATFYFSLPPASTQESDPGVSG